MIFVGHDRRGIGNDMNRIHARSVRSNIDVRRLAGQPRTIHGLGHDSARGIVHPFADVDVEFVSTACPGQLNLDALAGPISGNTCHGQVEYFAIDPVDAGRFGVHPATGRGCRLVPVGSGATGAWSDAAGSRILRTGLDARNSSKEPNAGEQQEDAQADLSRDGG